MRVTHFFVAAFLILLTSCGSEGTELSQNDANTVYDGNSDDVEFTGQVIKIVDYPEDGLVVIIATDDAGNEVTYTCEYEGDRFFNCVPMPSPSDGDSTGTNCPPDCAVSAIPEAALTDFTGGNESNSTPVVGINGDQIKSNKARSIIIPSGLIQKVVAETKATHLRLYTGIRDNKRVLMVYTITPGTKAGAGKFYFIPLKEGKMV
jgi:hypothetical protein